MGSIKTGPARIIAGTAHWQALPCAQSGKDDSGADILVQSGPERHTLEGEGLKTLSSAITWKNKTPIKIDHTREL